jgi:hypothetical protein
LCIYISKIEKIENCEKNNVFFLNVKCFLKNVWGYPYWKPHTFFLLKIKKTLFFSQFSIFFYLWNINTQSCVITSINILI